MEVPKLRALVPKLAFWGNFIIVLKRISARNLKNTFKRPKNVIWRSKAMIFYRNVFNLNKMHFPWTFPTLQGPGPGPYGLIWAHMGSYFRLLVQFRLFRIQNWVFDKISRWFCMVLRGEAQKTVLPPKNLEIRPKTKSTTKNIQQYEKI